MKSSDREMMNAMLVASGLMSVGYAFIESKKPSENTASYFIHEYNKELLAGISSSKDFGKWCIFKKTTEIDEVWKKIQAAVKRGRFVAAKVSTVVGAKKHGGNHVICVYTPDWSNRVEVMEARKRLRRLGFKDELGYKRDIETANRVYGSDNEWFIKA